jgi:hypothetical protein
MINRILGELAKLQDADLFVLRSGLHKEFRARGLAFSVGAVGEQLAIEYFKKTPGLINLQMAPPGTKNVDALSRDGDRFSIKTICEGSKTGTIYADKDDANKQLFENLLIVRLSREWNLESIHQFSWSQFLGVRSWDSRMRAWYVSISKKNLSLATEVYNAERP